MLVTRPESVMVLAFVIHAGYAWMSTEVGVWEWSIAGILLVLSGLAATGLVATLEQWPLVRGGLMLSTLVLVGELTAASATSPLVAWYALIALVYPVVLPARQARFVPLVVGGSYFFVAHFGGEALDTLSAAIGGGGFLGAGLVSYIVGHVVLDLRTERDRMASRLHQAEGTLNVAFATSSSGMAIVDLDGSFITVNRALCDFLERPAEWLLAVSWAQVVHPDDLDQFVEHLRRLVDGEVWSFQRETRFLLPEDRVGYGLVGVSVVAGASGRPEHLFAHVTNISDRVRSEARLRTSEANFRALFEKSPVAVWQVDLTEVADLTAEWRASGIESPGRHLLEDPDALSEVLREVAVRSVNEAARTIFGAETRAEFAEGLRSGLLGAGHRDVIAELLRALDEGVMTAGCDVTLTDFDGTDHRGLVRILVPTVEDEPDLTGVIVAFVDATDQHRTETALLRVEERLSTVMASVPIMLFVVDQDGVFTLSEGQALAALGQVPGQAVGRSAFEVFRSSDTMIRNLRRALGGEGFTGVDEIGELVLETRYSPLWEQGNVSRVIGVAYDITDRVRATERLQEMVRSKDEFVATVSHELRTPLTAVVGFAAQLSAELGSMTSDEVASYVDLIGEQAMEMSDLVEDLLVASRSEQGEIPVRGDAVDLWEEIDAVLSVRDIDREVEMARGPVAPKVFADPMRVRQVFRNLITNAERYGGPHVKVEVGRTPDTWTLYVSDDGDGIPQHNRAAIFEPYHRAHRTVGRTESVGLGLTVSRQLARLMGGDLTYDHVDGWSVFALSLRAV